MHEFSYWNFGMSQSWDSLMSLFPKYEIQLICRKASIGPTMLDTTAYYTFLPHLVFLPGHQIFCLHVLGAGKEVSEGRVLCVGEFSVNKKLRGYGGLSFWWGMYKMQQQQWVLLCIVVFQKGVRHEIPFLGQLITKCFQFSYLVSSWMVKEYYLNLSFRNMLLMVSIWL